MSDLPATILLTYGQAAELLGVSDRTVWSLVKKGELPAVRLAGRTVRIDRRDLDQFIADRKDERSERVTQNKGKHT